MVEAEATSAQHRSRGRPATRQRGVAEEVLRDIRSRSSSDCKRLSVDEIDLILGDIRRRSRSRSRSSRPPPPTSLPPSLPEDSWLPFGQEAKINTGRGRPRRRKRPKSMAGSCLRGAGENSERNDGKEWLNNPLYEAKLQSSRNARPLPPDNPPDNGDASSNPAAGCSSSSPAASCSSEPANDLASCEGKEEEKDGLHRDDRGKDLNEGLNDDDEEEGGGGRGGPIPPKTGTENHDSDSEAMGMVRRLKERLRDMGEELERVRAAADKISVDIDELQSEDTFEAGEHCPSAFTEPITEEYVVEEPADEESECEVKVGGGGGLVITEVTSPTPTRVPTSSVIRPRPHSLWGEDVKGDDLFGAKRYANYVYALFDSSIFVTLL